MKTEFSNLFKECTNSTGKYEGVSHPFFYIKAVIEKNEIPFDRDKLLDSYTYYNQLINETKNQYIIFELELCLLQKNKGEYLNHIVFSLYKDLKNLKENSTTTPHHELAKNQIFYVFSKICNSNKSVYLNNLNRKRLLKWYYLKEPIKSFKLKIMPEEKWFENYLMFRMQNSFAYNFISKDTSITSFKALFEGKYLENKINWIDNKSSLYYFIQKLICSKLIENPKNKHWQITSEFFLLKGESIRPKDLTNQKATTNSLKRQNIDIFINRLKPQNS
jgi:hypothetical protein